MPPPPLQGRTVDAIAFSTLIKVMFLQLVRAYTALSLWLTSHASQSLAFRVGFFLNYFAERTYVMLKASFFPKFYASLHNYLSWEMSETFKTYTPVFTPLRVGISIKNWSSVITCVA